MKNDKRKQFFQRIKFIKAKDMFSIFPMIIGLFCSFFVRIFKKNIWLVCERKNEARDNGYWFFKYLCENHKEINSIYAINKKSVDYGKVKKLGKVIRYGSLAHWIYYFSAKWNISSQKEGKPNAAICFIIEVYFGFRKNRIYLKHGIIKDAQRWIYYDVSKLTMLCCASAREQRFIQENFGYNPNDIKLVGLARFDNLMSSHETKRQIIVMPTMREWLRVISSDTTKYEKSNIFTESEYYITWTSFLNNNSLKEVLEKNNVKLLFYPHPAMQKYLKDFLINSEMIEIASSQKYDMQELLMESAFLITDYSSIYFDFAYMKKPLCYYQFDYEKYRQGQYQEGYFSYDKDGFGPVFNNEKDVIEYISFIIDNDMKIEKKYYERSNTFFAFCDDKNCERIYNAIIERRK